MSIEDGADAAQAVIRALGIERLACLIGNLMGGMNALAFLTRHPGIARSHINISGAARALPFSIAIRSLQREAIRLDRSEEHTSELQSLMRTSYAVFCLKTKKTPRCTHKHRT